MSRSRRILPVAMLSIGLLTAACGRLVQGGQGQGGDGTPVGDQTGRDPSGIEHPTRADELVLRVATGGGFVPPSALFRTVPEFSLFGDGSVVTQGPQIEIYPGPAMPNLLSRVVTEAGIQAIVEAAKEAGLLGPDRQLDYPWVADAPTTTFTLVAGGATHVISAYALGFEEGPDAADGPSLAPSMAEARGALSELRGKLLDLAPWLPAGTVGPEAPFPVVRLGIQVSPAFEPDPGLAQQKVRWPLPEQPLASFGAPVQGMPDTRCGMVTGADLDALSPKLAQANELTPWRSGPGMFALALRPLLPDESGCA